MGHSQSEGMMFEDEQEESSQFVLLRADASDLVPMRQMNEYSEYEEKVGCCFGIFKKTKKRQIKRQQEMSMF